MAKSKHASKPTPKVPRPAKVSRSRSTSEARSSSSADTDSALLPANSSSSQTRLSDPSASPATGEVGRQDQPAPICPYHGVQCTAKRSEGFFTRYYCPEEDCSFSAKVPRPQIKRRVQQDREQDNYSAR